uniref:ADAM metallopeptidase domain 32 n=1 Tax=Rousettus aegyptiacus TaxID=9407 RepID=A0A7J8DV22_ROUAE|nr:ADAM metallopeptidase domain 32 [Rousettus aegyptiacus]
MNKASMNVRAHIALWINVFKFLEILRRRMAESYGNSILRLEESPFLFHSGCTNLHSHRQCMRVPFSSQPPQHLSLLVLLTKVILTGSKNAPFACYEEIQSHGDRFGNCGRERGNYKMCTWK